MKLPRISKLALGTLLLTAAHLSSASLMGDTVSLDATAGGGATATILTPAGASPQDALVNGISPEFEVCVNHADCSGGAGLLITIDIKELEIDFTFNGDMTGLGGDFMLKLGDLDFSPAATITGGAFTGGSGSSFVGFDGGQIDLMSPVGADFLIFSGFDIFTSGAVTATFAINTAAAAPEPGALALFGLGFAGLGFARRRTR